MSPAEKISERLKELPHMTEEHLAALEKHGLTTPEKLLEVLRDESKWKIVHPELKGIGPKTAEKWKSILEESKAQKPAEAAVPEAKTEAAPPAPAKKVVRQVKKPVEEKKEEPKPAAEKEEKKIVPEKKPAPEKKPVAVKKPKPEKEAIEEEKEAEEEVEVVEEGEYVPNQKPKLSPELIEALKKRKKVAATRPDFYRQEYGRFSRLQTGWRKPRGIHSKTRMKMRYRRPMVNIGYAGPKLSKGLHPSGFSEVHIFNVADLDKISNADRQAARIAHSVGQRKRELIIKRADELGIRVLNRS